MSCSKVLAYLSDNLLTVAGTFDADGTPLTGVTDSLTGSAVTTATVEATIEDLAGDELSGVSFPLSLPHVGSPDGTYRANVSDSLVTVPGQVVKIIVTIDDGADRRDRRVLYVTIEESA
ncbi:hypothetical protein LCGC14_1733070 [marine sediment metagenome]|uniref:Uncharacterized protein n=1 Tax=marine sediment metagenome TaxID=412755 RepID=A0A0F9K8M3_9ZZZZ